MAAFTAIVATGAVLLTAKDAGARRLATAGDVPSHLIVSDTGLRCGEAMFDVCCPAEYGACAPGMVCMGTLCEPCGDDGEQPCNYGAADLWSATFEANDGSGADGSAPIDFLTLPPGGIESQGGFYGYDAAGAYGYDDVLGVYGYDDVLGAYGYDDVAGVYGGSLEEDPVIIADGKFVTPGTVTPSGTITATGTITPAGSTATPPGSTAIPAGSTATGGSIGGTAAGSGGAGGSGGVLVNDLSGGPEVTEDMRSMESGSEMADPQQTADAAEETTSTGSNSIAPAGAAVAGVAVLMAGVAALTYSKRATLFAGAGAATATAV